MTFTIRLFVYLSFLSSAVASISFIVGGFRGLMHLSTKPFLITGGVGLILCFLFFGLGFLRSIIEDKKRGL